MRNRAGTLTELPPFFLLPPYFLFLPHCSLFLTSLPPSASTSPGIYVSAVAVETGHTNTAAADRKCCGTTMASLRLGARARHPSPPVPPSSPSVPSSLRAIILKAICGPHRSYVSLLPTVPSPLSLIIIIISVAFFQLCPSPPASLLRLFFFRLRPHFFFVFRKIS